MVDLSQLYDFRFGQTGLAKRRGVWRVLCAEYFDKLVPPNATVVDLACGYGEFINQVRADRKFAVDLNPDAARYLGPDVAFKQTSALDLSSLPEGEIDVAFASNFLEHFETKKDLDRLFAEVLRVLRPGGQFIVVGPNIQYAYREYWDFYDHYLPLSHLSLCEGLMLAGFMPERVIDRFLPYTMQGRTPTWDILIKLYLRLPFAWRFLGKQFLVVARKPE
jgi:SAM-dependent methyltransferase